MVVNLTIPSYVYSQYSDDEDIQAFVASYNTYAQLYLNTFINLGLPLYPQFTSSFLDWVGTSLYGYSRPLLPSGSNKSYGPYNTLLYNDNLPFNGYKLVGPANYFATSDDVYIRCLNWHFFKGDGKEFTIPWLKRRVARFLFGPGQVPVNENDGWNYDVSGQYQISVTFGTNHTATITIVSGTTAQVKGALYNEMLFNGVNAVFNKVTAAYTPVQIPALAPVFQAAVLAGALELPFQYTWSVNI